MQGNQLYDPYGNSRYQSGSLTTSKGFTGQYNDNLTGLDDYGSRYYDPAAGVFLSADPIVGDLAGANPYEYVGANPETNTDPSGEMVTCGAGCGGGSPVPPVQPPPSSWLGGGGSGASGVVPIQEAQNLNLQPDACTLYGCKTVATVPVNELVPGSGSGSPTGGGRYCLAGGGSTFSSMGGVLVASSSVGGCVSGGESQSSSGTPAHVVQHLIPYALCPLGFDCSDENGEMISLVRVGEQSDSGFAASSAPEGAGNLFPQEEELAQGREEPGMVPRSVNPDDKQTFAILKAEEVTF